MLFLQTRQSTWPLRAVLSFHYMLVGTVSVKWTKRLVAHVKLSGPYRMKKRIQISGDSFFLSRPSTSITILMKQVIRKVLIFSFIYVRLYHSYRLSSLPSAIDQFPLPYTVRLSYICDFVFFVFCLRALFLLLGSFQSSRFAFLLDPWLWVSGEINIDIEEKPAHNCYGIS